MRKKILAALLAAALFAGTALAATVVTTGNVNLRSGPGKEYDIVTDIGVGRELEFLGDVSTDLRGVDWYHVGINGKTGWVSSKYADLLDNGGDVDESYDSGDGYDGDGGAELSGADLSSCYWKDLAASAAALGLTDYRREENSEVPNQYSGGGVTLAGYDIVEDITVTQPGWALLGVSVGMDVDEARSALAAAGLAVAVEGSGYFSAEFPGENAMLQAIDNFGGCVNVEGAGGKVISVNMTSYTG